MPASSSNGSIEPQGHLKFFPWALSFSLALSLDSKSLHELFDASTALLPGVPSTRGVIHCNNSLVGVVFCLTWLSSPTHPSSTYSSCPVTRGLLALLTCAGTFGPLFLFERHNNTALWADGPGTPATTRGPLHTRRDMTAIQVPHSYSYIDKGAVMHTPPPRLGMHICY